MNLFAAPKPVALRPGETLVWSGRPCWRTLARRAFHMRGLVLYVCLLVFLNAVAARLQHLAPVDALWGEAPVLVLGGAVVAATALLAWATGRSTRYTVTNQRVVLQYGVALPATVTLPMRLVAAVAVSDHAVGDVAIRLKPGAAVPFVKLWPHARPWRIARPEPALRALPGAAELGALLGRTVASAQAVEQVGPSWTPVQAMAA